MIKNSSSGKEVQIFAKNRYIMSPFKARRVIDQIRGRSFEETLMILELIPYRASFLILKLVYSAVANATHNMGLNEADSFISEAKVNRSFFFKKIRARARGRSFPIRKPNCDITIVLKDKSKLFLDQSKI